MSAGSPTVSCAMENNKPNEAEAFVRMPDEAPLIAALVLDVGLLVPDSRNNSDLRIYECGRVALVVMPSEDDFLSISLHGATRWNSDVDFARFVAGALDCQVRCDPGSEFPEVSPYSNIFLNLQKGKETLVAWG